MGRPNPKSDVTKILAALKKHGPMREADLKARAGVGSIGEFYVELRDFHGVGRLWDWMNWPDGNDKLYYLGWTADPEWAHAEMTKGYREEQVIREKYGLEIT